MNGDEVRELVRQKYAKAGFEHIALEITRTYDLINLLAHNLVFTTAIEEDKELDGVLVSAFIRARKPAQKVVAGKDFSVKIAQQEDFLKIHELLIKNGLPTAGVDPANGSYYIAGNKELMGIIGVEHYGTSAMLRSLAVKPQFQKAGIARALIDYVLLALKGTGFTDVYLLTNTADRYLARYGFVKIERSKVPANVLTTSALGDACPSSSTCMHLEL